MASKSMTCMALVFSFCVQGVFGGGFACEQLDKGACSFAVSSEGVRCVLEKTVVQGEAESYVCRASGIEATSDRLMVTNWIETDECVAACGVDRGSLGISSDALLDHGFTGKLCSPQCYRGCPNIVDLYFNLAAGESVFLPKLCEMQGMSHRRAMSEIRSSGLVAEGPVAGRSNALATGPVASLSGGILATAPVGAPF
ncbi:hypothetical protein QJS04_geneDACA000435 [Acorus gramineus]|uniref:PAR1 protein n=1 Tax=Acorus gramineus TaxID=55184 RepID=A0AAV9APB5_ACOGR|nr:hypothetical protein QJS04_geneDACA000435 [Acorus gramineus]